MIMDYQGIFGKYDHWINRLDVYYSLIWTLESEIFVILTKALYNLGLYEKYVISNYGKHI